MKLSLLLLLSALSGVALAGTALSGFKSKSEARAALTGARMALQRRDAAALKKLYEDWKLQYGITYATPEEDAMRYKVFVKTVRSVDAHNNNGTTTFWRGLNRFAALTRGEFKSMLMNPQKLIAEMGRVAAPSKEVEQTRTVRPRAYPKSKDWEKEGYVTSVKDQGNCGSCWAFSTVGVIESKLRFLANKTYDLSEQQVVDCCSASAGCDGGWPWDSFAYAASNNLVAESDYPYTSGKCNSKSASCTYACPTDTNMCLSCKTNSLGSGGIKVSWGATETRAWTDTCGLSSGTTKEDLMQALATNGPLAITFNAYGDFQTYDGGVIDLADGDCGTPKTKKYANGCFAKINHMVLLVGYDSDAKEWRLRNQWGSDWGESGYFRMSMMDGLWGTCQMYVYSGYYATSAVDTDDPCYGVSCMVPPSLCHTAPGKCVNGGCVYSERPCTTPPSKCEKATGKCNKATGECSYEKKVCDQPPSSCFFPAGSCSPTTGQCYYTAKLCISPPTKCHNPVGTCVAGECVYTEKDCTSTNKCEVARGSCRLSDGNCTYTAKQCNSPPSICHVSNGTCAILTGLCTYDLKTCTSPPSVCHTSPGYCSTTSGACVYPEKTCVSTNKCEVSAGTCSTATGQCVFQKVSCTSPPSDCYVSPGTCVSTTGECRYAVKAKGTACASGSCDGAGRCVR